MSEAIKIEKRIVSQAVQTVEPVEAKTEAPKEVKVELMNENISRPEFLVGATYKIKPATDEHALYITINDIILNEDTDEEVRRPYEVFINSKSMEHYQWVIALTRLISAVFRKGGDSWFLVEELLSVYNPNGGYYQKGGKYMNSIVAHIGSVIERHLTNLGLNPNEPMSDATKALIDEKKAQFEKDGSATHINADESPEDNPFPANASLCKKCHNKSVIIMDGCQTCLNCGESK